jgi:hypothetical protein
MRVVRTADVMKRSKSKTLAGLKLDAKSHQIES